MILLEAGMRVRIKNYDSNVHNSSGDIYWNSNMRKFCGKTGTIRERENRSNCYSYNIDIDGIGKHEWRQWTWEETWIEPCRPEVKLPEDLFTL